MTAKANTSILDEDSILASEIVVELRVSEVTCVEVPESTEAYYRRLCNDQ